MKITLPSGEEKEVQICMFAALDGWDMQNRFLEFAASTDSHTRRIYTMDVLAYAKVISGDQEIPLSTGALIDNHLQTWQNVQAVFEEVLSQNGINPKNHADKSSYWSAAGAEMAVAFIAEAAKLMGPAMEMMSNADKS